MDAYFLCDKYYMLMDTIKQMCCMNNINWTCNELEKAGFLCQYEYALTSNTQTCLICHLI